MMISAHILKQPELRHGTKEERELYRYAVRLQKGLRRAKQVKTAERIIQA